MENRVIQHGLINISAYVGHNLKTTGFDQFLFTHQITILREVLRGNGEFFYDSILEIIKDRCIPLTHLLTGS